MPYIPKDQMIHDATSTLISLLEEMPFINIKTVTCKAQEDLDDAIGFTINVGIKNKEWSLWVETKSSGEPKSIREAAYSLQRFSKKNICPILAAPYLSEETQNICKQAGVNYLDLSGNFRITFDTVFLERTGHPNKVIERRPLKTLFSPKSSRIFRKMLLQPHKAWQVQELAKETDTSNGLVSRLKQKMESMDWLPSDGTLQLRSPESVLQSWSKIYSYQDNEMLQVYAPSESATNERNLVEYCLQNEIKCALTLFSSANRLEPFVRGIIKSFAYVDANLSIISQALDWKQVASGANFSLMRPNDTGYFYDLQEINGFPLVSDIQTYLDLNSYRGRGEEAAEALWERRIKRNW